MGVVTVSILPRVAAAFAIACLAACFGFLIAAICRGWAEETKHINESQGEQS